MANWNIEGLWRDMQERPLMYPLFRVYGAFMSIKRYEHMPFYFYPQGTAIVGLEDKLINRIDWCVDAHEEGRNQPAHFYNFYQRMVYVTKNFLRYQNSTVANLMYDTQAPVPTYHKMNSVIGLQNLKFYLAAGATHMLGMMYLSFFFRYRRLSLPTSLVIGSAYYCAFENINNILYKVLVDREVLNAARALGQEAHCQPTGTVKNRGFNYK
jgi:hypothetical protein